MEQYLHFLIQHWTLSVALVAILAMLLATYVQGGLLSGNKVGPMDATRLISHDDAVVIDVRDEGEYSQGHIINALHVPEKTLPDRLEKLASHRERPVIVCCRSGQRSAGAAALLRKHGFAKVYTLGGGILAWENANLPLVRK